MTLTSRAKIAAARRVVTVFASPLASVTSRRFTRPFPNAGNTSLSSLSTRDCSFCPSLKPSTSASASGELLHAMPDAGVRACSTATMPVASRVLNEEGVSLA
jgi:hypothetical protein